MQPSDKMCCFAGDSVRRLIVGPPGPSGPRGQKGERGEPGYIQTQSYSQSDSHLSSDRRQMETLDFSNVALKVTDYIKSESVTAVKHIQL